MKKSLTTLSPKWKILSALAVIALAVMACGSSTATPAPISQNDIATVVAATIQAMTAMAPTSVPATAVLPTLAPLPTSVPTFPPAQPTQPVVSASRITFAKGGTTGAVEGTIKANTGQSFVLAALQGQIMIVNSSSTNNDVVATVKTSGGTFLLTYGAHSPNWQGTLPTTEDYYVSVYNPSPTDENFSLSIEIPAPIRFAAGTDTTKLSGETVGGYVVAYSVFASAGQKMTVDLYSIGTNAAITIYGFTDGQPYIRSVTGATNYTFTLPLTQNYIVEVVPNAAKDVKYQLSVQVK